MRKFLANPYRLTALGLLFGVVLIAGTILWEERNPIASEDAEHHTAKVLIPKIIIELGVSLVVFGLIGASFEERSRRQVDQAIEGLGKEVFGSTAYQVFRRYHDERKLTRSGLDVTLKIEGSLDREFAQISSDFHYIIQNGLDEMQVVPLAIQEDDIIPHVPNNAKREAKFYWKVPGGSGVEIPAQLETIDGARVWKTKNELEANGSATVETRWSFAARHHDEYVLFMSYLTTGVRMSIQHPGDYDVSLFIPTMYPSMKTQIDVKKETEMCWTLNGSLMPGQAIVFRWKSRKPEHQNPNNVPVGNDNHRRSGRRRA